MPLSGPQWKQVAVNGRMQRVQPYPTNPRAAEMGSLLRQDLRRTVVVMIAVAMMCTVVATFEAEVVPQGPVNS